MKIVCVLFFVLNTLGWGLAHPRIELNDFISLPSLMIVLLPIYMSIAYRHGWKNLFNLKFHTDVWVKGGKEQDDLLKTIAYTALLTGALGMAMGLVITFGNWSDPSTFIKDFGSNMTISLLTSLYALFIFLVVVLLYFVGREDES